ncbi:1-deoxy-D-xylulose-5-phosphate synthase [Chlorobium sp. BLA1]|uniref:1-deoxy-D-xylulose-5-phosphate synthase n=1 Tax=Candidatus Chlorobium masyuteum TaxID=2716876 RepID=UPI0014209981|nr:1-deoxy-D-xylulose-5-phosphate synthase [Candidatus Chlorobium masyuteum]NHQ60118.1 1-deoxy-D-xylulose-5-phosphate synthase [Candidatus Chlorobium masyuteum]
MPESKHIAPIQPMIPLSEINSPEDLKHLSITQLQGVADECRNEVIKLVSVNGGHFASTLGVVELTVALHHVYSTPHDKIIWDVGHQAYVHKILTGRKERMQTNRQYGGLAGFPRISESPHDAFGTGHASTSISAAAGIAAARDLAGGTEKVIAVIGDGSMTGGMAFEAMNHLGDLKSDVLVILNDNQMAISPSTGGLRTHLINITLNKTYNKARKFIWNSISLLNNELGDAAKTAVRKLEDGFKAAFTPGAFFEALGLRYFGPIDGNNMEQLVKALKEMQELPHPKLLHIVTTKGKGFMPAEQNQSKWHAHSGGFDTTTGETLKKADTSLPPKYQEVFGEALVELALKDNRITAITAAMPSGTSLDLFQDALPNRFYDVGIAEGHAVTFAAGLATEGFKPVFAIYSTFLQRAYDQLIHDVAQQNLHVVFAIDRAGLVGEDGPTHHGSFDLSYLHTVPGLVIMAPADEQELRDMLYTALYDLKGPVAIRYPRGNGIGIPLRKNFESVTIGKGQIVREGSGLALLCIGNMTSKGIDVAEALQKEGIDASVVNMRFLKPLDTALIDEVVSRSTHLVVIEENSRIGGLGSAVIDHLNEKGLNKPVLKVALPDAFVTHGSMKELYREIGFDTPTMAENIKRFYRGEER